MRPLVQGDGMENPVIIIRRSVRSLCPVVFFLGLSMVLIGALSVAAAQLGDSLLGGILTSDLFPVLPLAITLELVRRSSSCLYVLNSGGIAQLEGRELHPQANYTDIEQVGVIQGLMGRLLNYGTVRLNVSGAYHSALIGIRNPHEVAGLLQELQGGEKILIQVREKVYLSDKPVLPQLEKLAA